MVWLYGSWSMVVFINLSSRSLTLIDERKDCHFRSKNNVVTCSIIHTFSINPTGYDVMLRPVEKPHAGTFQSGGERHVGPTVLCCPSMFFPMFFSMFFSMSSLFSLCKRCFPLFHQRLCTRFLAHLCDGESSPQPDRITFNVTEPHPEPMRSASDAAVMPQ